MCPSLIAAAAQMPEYDAVVMDALRFAKNDQAARGDHRKIVALAVERLSVEFGRFDDRMKDLAKHIRQAYDDVEKVQVTSGKITQPFAQIEGVELDDEAEEAKVLKLHNDRLRDGG